MSNYLHTWFFRDITKGREKQVVVSKINSFSKGRRSDFVVVVFYKSSCICNCINAAIYQGMSQQRKKTHNLIPRRKPNREIAPELCEALAWGGEKKFWESNPGFSMWIEDLILSKLSLNMVVKSACCNSEGQAGKSNNSKALLMGFEYKFQGLFSRTISLKFKQLLLN